MHCPRCGTNATSRQQFCRSCGLSLDKVAELLGEELAIQSSSPVSEAARLRERQQKFENWAGIAGLATFGLILLLLIVVVFSQMILKGGTLIIPGVLLILLTIGAGVMGVFQVYSKSLKAKLEARPLPPATKPLTIRGSGTYPLPPESVGERTTELFDMPRSPATGPVED
jgi:zinc ribbon protein